MGEERSSEAGYRAGRQVAANREIRAVFVADDQMALGVFHALHEARLKVPNDLSVVGFDDTPETSHFLPALTTVRLDFDAVGRACMAILITVTNAELPPPQLIVRASTAPPRRAPGKGQR